MVTTSSSSPPNTEAAAAAAASSVFDESLDSYLALVPRGLERVAIQLLHQYLAAGHGYQVHTCILGEEEETAAKAATEDSSLAGCCFDAWQARLPTKRRGADPLLSQCCRRPVGTIPHEQSQDVSFGYAAAAAAATTHSSHDAPRTLAQPDEPVLIWSQPGQLQGTVWLLVQTNAPVSVLLVHRLLLRALGPIVSLAAYFDQVDLSEQVPLAVVQTTLSQLLLCMGDGVGAGVRSSEQDESSSPDDDNNNNINNNNYPKHFASALVLWKEFVRASWGLSGTELDGLEQKVAAVVASIAGSTGTGRYREGAVQGDTDLSSSSSSTSSPLLYRLSCVRTDSKHYQYSRQDFLRAVADSILPTMYRPTQQQQEQQQQFWKVNLTDYDVEIVLFVRAKSLAIGLALLPYQKIPTNSFAAGAWPPDIALPYTKQVLGAGTNNLVRLRPATAQLLLQLCHLQPGDVVLDPCVGIGTLCLETLFMANHPRSSAGGVVALGGDLVLTPSGLAPMAANCATRARHIQQEQQASSATIPTTRHRSYADLMAWDATTLPVRTQSVDVIVSDLPFGQLCSSSSELGSILPLMVSEWARVLRPQTGRMVLLCGSYLPLLRALVQVNESQGDCASRASNPASSGALSSSSSTVWQLPCAAIFPVNIGGNLAWVVQISRGGTAWSPLTNHRKRVRKLTAKRDFIASHKVGVRKGKRLQA